MAGYIPQCESHLCRLIDAASETGGAFWPSVLDVRTGRYPERDHVPRRVYRLIGAPRGSTLYWDQPMIAAANALSELTGNPKYSRAADRYLEAFLSRCVAENGMFRWGNHAYFDLSRKTVVDFHRGHHELRPIVPAWDCFWRLAPERTAAYIRTMARRHLFDPASGGFNRHDDGKQGHAFLEAGGILCESLAWLYGKTGDGDLLDTALRIARYSYRHRDPVTGLVPNEPNMGRWDSKVCTSEIGLWAQSLLRAGRYSANPEFDEMAGNAVRAYLEWAFDDRTGRVFGQVGVRDGKPVVPEKPGYWPRQYADPWNTDQWPTHDYPMALAKACLSLYRTTADRAFRDAIEHCAAMAVRGCPGRTGSWAYAESYGHCIHFLALAGLELGDERFTADARLLAAEAMDTLLENGMFQGYADSHVYEAVDGVGCLLLALMALEHPHAIGTSGLEF